MKKDQYWVAIAVGLFLAIILYSAGYFDDVFAEKHYKSETEHYIEKILKTEELRRIRRKIGKYNIAQSDNHSLELKLIRLKPEEGYDKMQLIIENHSTEHSYRFLKKGCKGHLYNLDYSLTYWEYYGRERCSSIEKENFIIEEIGPLEIIEVELDLKFRFAKGYEKLDKELKEMTYELTLCPEKLSEGDLGMLSQDAEFKNERSQYSRQLKGKVQ